MVRKTLRDYIEDGRYTIVVAPRMKSLMFRIKELYPTAIVTTSIVDGIVGEKLLVDKWTAEVLGRNTALSKYRKEDVVYERFTKEFVEGGSVNINLSVKGYEEWERIFSQIKEQTNSCYMDFLNIPFYNSDDWKQKREEIIEASKPLSKEDISYELNGEVPKLYIKGNEVGVVSMTMHYVTAGEELGTKTVTFVYITKDNPEQKILSINNLGEVFEQ